MAILNDNGDKIDQKRDILFEIAEKTKERIAQKKKEVTLDNIKLKAMIMDNKTGYPFENALKSKLISFICEVKKASPSKGLIAKDFPYLQIAKDYEKSGAAAISCLTEPFYFQGSDEYLSKIVKNVKIPVLRKDFTVDEYMIYEAKVMGASAILLICSILDDYQLKTYFDIADSLGLSVLVETHTADEVRRAINCGARIIGVNNRNLRTFEVDIATSIELRKLVNNNIIFVSESGIKTKQDIAILNENKVNAVLIGETLMRADDKKAVLDDLISLSLPVKKAKIKICGIKKLETIDILNELKPDYVGFVFAKSSRQIGWRTAKILRNKLDKSIKTVGVFVNEDVQTIVWYLKQGIIDVVQLHGQESEDVIAQIKFKTNQPIIKAISVNSVCDVLKYKYSKADYLLLDNGAGGTGKSFDWSVLNELRNIDIDKEIFIAGGLSSQNVNEALDYRPYCVDVSGGVETDANKDDDKIRQFIETVRKNYDNMERYK